MTPSTRKSSLITLIMIKYRGYKHRMDKKTKKSDKSPKIPSPELAESAIPVETSVGAAQPASELIYRTIFDNAGDAIIIHDLNGKILDVNQITCDRLGFTREELLRMTPMDFDRPEYAQLVSERIHQIITNKNIIFETCHVSKGGTQIPTEISGRFIEYDGKQAVLSICRDITERKRMDEALRDSEKRYHTLFEQSPDGILLIDTEGKIIEFNETAHRQLGYSREEFAKLSLSDIDPFMSTEEIRAKIGKVLEAEQAEFVVKHRTKDGEVRDVNIITQSIVLAGKPVMYAIWHDITEGKRAEIKIMESEKLIRNILDSVDEGFIVVDRDFRILLVNKAYCSQVGGRVDDVVGRHCYEVSHKSLRPCFEEGEDCAVRHVFETGEPYSTTHRHSDAKGDLLYVETKAFPIRDSSGNIISVIETVQNITEKYLLEEERLRTQKLEAIGTLAGGIAHDFNNLLQGVFGYISMAKVTLEQKEKSLAMLEQAEKALHMSVNLTTQLLTFSKGGKPVKKKIPLQPVIENSAKFALSGSSADYRVELDTALWHVEADEGQIGQVIQNIVLNADQSMPLGGTIVIAAKNAQGSKKGMPQLPDEGKYIEISIKDNGVGISETYLSKIFDPYFTTKAKGSGLGLATCYSIIKNHGGIINVSSKMGEGTTFFIYLPAIEAEKEMPKPTELTHFVRKGKILVMDDEEMVRNIAGDMIEALGHNAELTEHGEETIEKYKAAMESGHPFDIVILDLTIRGGMGGRETMERLIAVDPKIRAIVSSGFSDDSAVSNYHDYGFSARLTKPYKLEELGDTLNNLLGR
jgi:PAS domain S-box-containing protein